MTSALLAAGVIVVLSGIVAKSVLSIVPGMLVVCIALTARMLTSQAVRSGIICSLSLSHSSARPGDTVRASLSLMNDQPFPIFWLNYAVGWPDGVVSRNAGLTAHYLSSRRSLSGTLSLRWFERVTRHIELEPQERGEFSFGPSLVRLSDPFGLESVSTEVATEGSLLVYPRVVPLHVAHASHLSPFGDMFSSSFLYQDPLYFRGIREYTPRDPMSRIDWKSTARTRELKVRMDDASFAEEVVVVVDVSTSDKAWEGVNRDLLERTIIIAASIISALAERNCIFSLRTNGVVRGQESAASMPVAAGQEHYIRCMALLGRLLEVRWGKIEQVLADLAPATGSRSQVFVLAPALSHSAQIEVGRLLAAGVKVTVVNTCPEPASLEFAGPVYEVLEKEPYSDLTRVTLHRRSS